MTTMSSQGVDAAQQEFSLEPENWDDFRALAHRAMDDMVDHLQTLREKPAWQATPEAVKANLRVPMPRVPMPENPGTAPQFGTEQPASTPQPENAGTPKRRSTVREAPPASRFDESVPAGSVYERTDSPPLASENGDQDNAAPGNASPKKGWWRR